MIPRSMLTMAITVNTTTQAGDGIVVEEVGTTYGRAMPTQAILNAPNGPVQRDSHRLIVLADAISIGMNVGDTLSWVVGSHTITATVDTITPRQSLNGFIEYYTVLAH